MNRLIRTMAGWRFEWVLVSLVLLLQVHIPFSQADVLLNWYSTDDAFYYFKVAQNVSEGRGVTFDGINLTNGFHPLWMLVCIPVFELSRFDLILPLRVLMVLLIFLNAATGVLIYRFSSRWIDRRAAALFALFWVFWPSVHAITTQKGIESGINAFFVVLLLEQLVSFHAREDEPIRLWEYLELGLVASLALFSRLDNIFVVVCAGIWLTFRKNNLSNYMLAFMLAGIVSVMSSFFLRLGFGAAFEPFLPSLYWMLIVGATLKVLLFFLFGLFNPPLSMPLRQEAMRLVGAAAISSAACGVVMIGLAVSGVLPTFPRLVLAYDAGLTLLMAIVIRAAAYALDRSPGAFIPPLETARENFGEWMRVGLGYFLPVVLLLGGYMLWSQATFGTSMPVSGQVKHWWGTIPDTVYGKPASTFGELFGFPEESQKGSWWLAFAPAQSLAEVISPGEKPAGGALQNGALLLVAVSMFFLIVIDWSRFGRNINASAWWALLAGCVIQVLYYGGTLYANTRYWYWINHMLAVLFLWGFLLDNLFERMERRSFWRKTARSAAFLAGAALALNFFVKVSLSYGPMNAERQGSNYRPEAAQVMALTDPGSMIGMTGGGAVAYFVQDRTVVNLDGLINSYEYFTSMKENTARDYIEEMGLDYVYGNEYILTSSNPYYKTLKGRLALIRPIYDMSLFKYKGLE